MSRPHIRSKSAISIGDRILGALSLLPHEKGDPQSLDLPQQRDHRTIESVEAVDVSSLTKNDVIILVMGPAGAGKSTFIQTVTNAKDYDTGQVAHGMQLGTVEISAVRVKFPDNHHVVLVDTPGLDGYNRSDAEILESIAEWAEQIPGTERSVAGILYLHRISDVRMTATMVTKFTAFQRLVGKNFFEHVVLTTTMWPEPNDSSYTQELQESEAREIDLQADHWKIMISRGSKSQRFCRTPESAWNIINHVVDVQSQRIVKDLQNLHHSKREMVRRILHRVKKFAERS